MRGTLCSVTLPLASSEAAMIGSAAFFAPWVAIEPSRREPPRTRNVVSNRSRMFIEQRPETSRRGGRRPAGKALPGQPLARPIS